MADNSMPPSLVSPVHQNSSSALPQNTVLASHGATAPSIAAQTQTQSTSGPPTNYPNAHSPNTSRTKWLPFTLRWYFLIVPSLASLAFAIAISYLCWYSSRNYGLGKDDGSSWILFGWRFTPTLVAVLYTQTTVILFEDVKRTEPWARLAKAPSGGASAHGTLLQTPKAWWAILVDLTFKRKKVGKTSWALVCSTFVHVLALLAISPLSSALLTSEEVVIPQTISFTRLVPKPNVQLPMDATRETYFTSMSVLTQNITTSAWVSDTSLTLPFWPSSEEAQLGPNVVSTHGSWGTQTTVFTSSFNCQDMILESAELRNQTWQAYDWHRWRYNGTQPMVHYLLTTPDQCRYELDVHPAADIAYNGGVTWTDATTYLPLQTGSLPIDYRLISANVTPTSPYARIKSSKECKGREIIVISTPWTLPISLPQPPAYLMPNQAYTRSPDFRMRALLCESRYSSTERNITVSMSPGAQPSLENAPYNIGIPKDISQSLVNITRFQELSLGDQWRNFIYREGMWKDIADSKPSQIRMTTGKSEIVQSAGFSGLGMVLGLLSAWNITSMIEDASFLESASRVKGRFFMELMRASFTNSQIMQTDVVLGRATVLEDRVIVLQEIGIVLASLFAMSFFLLLVTFWSSRLPRRPLNLQTEPSSTIGMSMLLDPRTTSISTLKNMHNASRRNIYATIQSETFSTSNSTLFEDSSGSRPNLVNKPRKRHNWRPRPIRLKNLYALGVFLALVVTSLLLLRAFSLRSRLYQQAFTYQTDLSKYGLSFSTFAPISIAPTILSIAITLWWDQLDMTVRLLQPYISMSHSPTPISSGAGLTYRSKTWAGAAARAARHRHWVLFLVAVGSTLCQVLTVSMSALFERRAVNVTSDFLLNRTLETRQVPLVTKIDLDINILDAVDQSALDQTTEAMGPLYQDNSHNWLQSAAVQLSLNGSQQAWSLDDWNFIPVDLSEAQGSMSAKSAGNVTQEKKFVGSSNVTLSTSALRAWLKCEPIDQVANQSSWLETLSGDDLAKEANTNATLAVDVFQFPPLLFENTTYSTTVLGKIQDVTCCTNGTISDPQPAVIGYWSPFTQRGSLGFPYEDQQWPISFVIKWIVGKLSTVESAANLVPLYYEHPPSIQTASCKPVIDVAEATVLVSKDTGLVYSYDLTTIPSPMDSPWSEVFQRHDLSDSNQHYNRTHVGQLNFTTSFGIFFLGGLLGASGREAEPGAWTSAFSLHDQGRGLNMDLMSYSMYALADHNPEALLNYTTLTTHANRTFQGFFQRFVNNKLSMTEGGWAYQKIDEELEGLGPPVDVNGTAMTGRTFPVLNTNRTVVATTSDRIQVLYISPLAAYLSVGILVWLIATTAVIICIQRKFTSSVLRNVELIADVILLVAGSHNLLELVQEKGLALRRDQKVMTKLGWFKGRDGEVRWGVEVVGGRNAVEWMDPPIKDFW